MEVLTATGADSELPSAQTFRSICSVEHRNLLRKQSEHTPTTQSVVSEFTARYYTPYL
jgi:hypothetical protein